MQQGAAKLLIIIMTAIIVWAGFGWLEARAVTADIKLVELGGLDDTAGAIGYPSAGRDVTKSDLADRIGLIINVVLSLIGIVFFILIWIGGFGIAYAGGNEEQVKKGKDRIKNGAIGILIVFSAYLVAQLVLAIASAGVFKID